LLTKAKKPKTMVQIMPHDKAENSPRSKLPMVVGSSPASSGRGVAPGAAFISQLIAERQHLPPQRERRRAPVDIALGCYEAAGQQAVRRMPPGYRKTVLA
jgi:hypothetical protein